MSYDKVAGDVWLDVYRSQSLWNRAVSYDGKGKPLFLGDVESQSLWNRAVSYDRNSQVGLIEYVRLNPFGTGQCLTTFVTSETSTAQFRLNPFGTGQCLTTCNSLCNWRNRICLNPFGTGQCLTTSDKQRKGQFPKSSQSLWNRAVSYDCSGVIKPCATRLTEATSQLFPRLRELGLDLAKC